MIRSERTGSAFDKRERLRRRYRSNRMRILFVGETPLVSGRFFYQGDSGLDRAVRDTFTLEDAADRSLGIWRGCSALTFDDEKTARRLRGFILA